MSELVQSSALLDAFAGELGGYWPMERELLATIAELLSSLVIITLKAHGARRVPQQLKVPRPEGLGGAPHPDAIPMSEYMLKMVKG